MTHLRVIGGAKRLIGLFVCCHANKGIGEVGDIMGCEVIECVARRLLTDDSFVRVRPDCLLCHFFSGSTTVSTGQLVRVNIQRKRGPPVLTSQ